MRVTRSSLVLPAVLLACAAGCEDSDGQPGSPGIAIRPAAAFVQAGGTVAFSAVVTGLPDATVAWSVLAGSGGSVSAGGTYTAPATGGVHRVVVQSLADPRYRAMAEVKVTAPGPAYPGAWTDVGPMTTPRYRCAAVAMPDGRLWVSGGTGASTWIPLASSEVLPAGGGSFVPSVPMTVGRINHAATLMPDGTLLVTGGSIDDAGAVTASAEVVDLAAGTSTPVGSMSQGRALHTATLLADGRVLVAGGYGGAPAGETRSAEVYSPVTRSFSPAGDLAQARFEHSATLLPDGRVLVVGARTSTGSKGPVEVFDPATGVFRSLGALGLPRYAHAAVLLPDGRVAVLGGYSDQGSPGPVTSIEAISPSGSITQVGDLRHGREWHAAHLMPNGKILVAGGFAAVDVLPAEWVDPGTFGSIDAASPAGSHALSPGVLLPGGRLALVGGVLTTEATTSVEVFE